MHAHLHQYISAIKVDFTIYTLQFGTHKYSKLYVLKNMCKNQNKGICVLICDSGCQPQAVWSKITDQHRFMMIKNVSILKLPKTEQIHEFPMTRSNLVASACSKTEVAAVGKTFSQYTMVWVHDNICRLLLQYASFFLHSQRLVYLWH